MSSSHSAWKTWEMGKLERRTPGRSKNKLAPQSASQASDAKPPEYIRRREDQISLTLFNLAKEEAEKKGFEKGRAEGLKRGYTEGEESVRAEHAEQLQQEIAATVKPIKELATTFRQAVEGLDNEVSYALVELALDIAQQLSGRALQLKPAHILDDIEDLLEENPTLTGSPTLYVSIDDLSLVESHLQQTLSAAGWNLRADMALSRGDCRIETDQREVDATNSDRWLRLLHAVGHGEH